MANDGETVRLTRAMIEAGATTGSGGYNRPQMEALGVPWPLRAGWKDRMAGAVVFRKNYEAFLHLRGATAPRDGGEGGVTDDCCRRCQRLSRAVNILIAAGHLTDERYRQALRLVSDE
jgi:hypothetical protein